MNAEPSRLATAALFCLLGTTGCIDRVAMQMRYDSQRDDCREKAEDALDRDIGEDDISGSNIRSKADGAKSRELAGHFSECMEEGGWTIATPSHNAAPSGPVPMPPSSPVPGPRPGVGYAEAGGSQYPGQVNPGPATAAMRRPPATSAAAPTRSQPPAAYTVPPASASAPMPVVAGASRDDDSPQAEFDKQFGGH